jgi:predicted ester cyclase
MSHKTPEALGLAFYAAFDQNNPALFDDVLAVDWKPHPPVPGNPGGRAGQQGTLAFLHQVFADFRYQVEEVIVAENRVICRALLTGKQVGEFLGIAARGKTVAMSTMEIHTVKDGLITDTWHIEDFFGAYMQLPSTSASQ